MSDLNNRKIGGTLACKHGISAETAHTVHGNGSASCSGTRFSMGQEPMRNRRTDGKTAISTNCAFPGGTASAIGSDNTRMVVEKKRRTSHYRHAAPTDIGAGGLPSDIYHAIGHKRTWPCRRCSGGSKVLRLHRNQPCAADRRFPCGKAPCPGNDTGISSPQPWVAHPYKNSESGHALPLTTPRCRRS